VIRNHTLHDKTNRNGGLVCEYAIANDMVVASTFFQHKNIYKGTWISPDILTLNQIDHVLVNNNKKQMIQDEGTLRGSNCDSDHFLVKIIVKQKLILTQKFVDKLRWNTSNLQNPEKLVDYNKRLNDRLETQEETENVEQDWQNIKTAILEVTKETIQMQPRITYNEWWDEECREAIKEKNTGKEKCLQRRTRATQEEYEEKRRMATKICRNKKKHWLNNRIKTIEEAHRRNETRKFYKNIKKFRKIEQAGTLLLCKDDKGNVLTEKQQVLERWKQYFSEVLNRELIPKHTNSKHETENSNKEVEITPPTYNEVNDITQKLRNNKAPGPDNVISELIKEGGQKLKHRIHMLILKIWEKEDLLADWENSIICPIYKKRRSTAM
jgi:hypothetical protein